MLRRIFSRLRALRIRILWPHEGYAVFEIDADYPGQGRTLWGIYATWEQAQRTAEGIDAAYRREGIDDGRVLRVSKRPETMWF